MKFGDLVSVVVITYNSEKYIVEALDSVLSQDYRNIELIISDDASKDNTISLVEDWLKANGNKFTYTVLLKSQKNHGTSLNVNSGFNNSNGLWIKLLAGDDVLLPTCISNNVKYILQNDCQSVLYSELIMFKDRNEKRIFMKQSIEECKFCEKLGELNAEKQYKILLKRDMMVTASLFINRKMFDLIGQCDNIIPLIEDWPLRLKITKSGFNIYYMSKKTVFHRHEESVTRKTEYYFHERHLSNLNKLKKHYCYPAIKPFHLIYYFEELLLKMEEIIIIKIFANKRNSITIGVAKFFSVLMPRNWKKVFYKIGQIKESARCR